MKLTLSICLFPVLILIQAPGLSRVLAQENSNQALRPEDLGSLDGIVNGQIEAGNIPGAVVLIGNQGKVVYRKAFGYRSLKPDKTPMTEDTIFDIASLTKVVATTTAVMQLAEQGRLNLDEPVAKYWPGFGVNGKRKITVRQCLIHYSGLRPDLRLKKRWSGYDRALRLIVSEKPVMSPGRGYIYSDINFEILGELVRRVSGMPLDVYCKEYIFDPLGMKDTGFKISQDSFDRLAPTEFGLTGKVHDPTACRMGGVSGHAGLFSTADDLSIFANMLLSGGSAGGKTILMPKTVDMMTVSQSPSGGVERGLGWKIEPPFVNKPDEPNSTCSYSHTGYTGTSIWIDPASKSYIIILTNRVHPYGGGDAGPIRKEVPAQFFAALSLTVTATGQGRTDPDREKVRPGLDVLASEGFAPLAGLRVGIITNRSGIDSEGRQNIDVLKNAPDVKLAAIFSPEHGLYADMDEKVKPGIEPSTGLPVYSLYGEVNRPTDGMLDGIDAILFDVQDAGARFYTYISTMTYAMEAAAKKGIDFYVLDRPNPINAAVIQGPVMDEGLKSFTGCFPLPVRHGMTVGEIAEMINAENRIGAKLHVVKMMGYKRDSWYDETGLKWVSPSPNLRNLRETILYPGVAMVEGANVSVGRGTKSPFELLGAPWIRGKRLASYLERRKIQGVRFEPVDFRPGDSIYKDRVCHGVRIALVDRRAVNAPALGIEIASALRRLYPKKFTLEKTLGMIGSRTVLKSIKDKKDPRSIALNWEAGLREFQEKRSKYLLY